MFGTIGHMRPRAGHDAEIGRLLEEWERDIRPRIPGAVTSITGKCARHDGEMITVVLMRDEPTYRTLAASAEQDAWYRRLLEHLEAPPEWEDVSWEQVLGDPATATA